MSVSSINSLKENLEDLCKRLHDLDDQLNTNNLSPQEIIEKISFLEKARTELSSKKIILENTTIDGNTKEQKELAGLQDKCDKILEIWDECHTKCQNTNLDEMEKMIHVDSEDTLRKLLRQLDLLSLNPLISKTQKERIHSIRDQVHIAIAQAKAAKVQQEDLLEECRSFYEQLNTCSDVEAQASFNALSPQTQQAIFKKLIEMFKSDLAYLPHMLDSGLQRFNREEVTQALSHLTNIKRIKRDENVETKQEFSPDTFGNLNHLSIEIILNILSMLSPEDLLTLSQVSKGFKKLCNEPELWITTLSEKTGIKDLEIKEDYRQWIKATILRDKIEKGIHTFKMLGSHTSNIDALSILGNVLFSRSCDGVIKIWDLRTEKCFATLQPDQENYQRTSGTINLSLSRSPDTIKIWDSKTGTSKSLLLESPKDLDGCCMLIEGNFAYHCPKEGNINFVDMRTGQTIGLFKTTITVRNLCKRGDILYWSYGERGSPINILDLRPSYSDLLNVADRILEQGDISRFQSFGWPCQTAVYRELADMEYITQVEATEAFNFQQPTTTDEKRAQAIYRFVARHIMELFEKGSKRQALALFKKLPYIMRSDIYTELSKLGVQGRGEAFLSWGKDTTDKKRKEAIHNYLENDNDDSEFSESDDSN